jgi:beta-phosphoglucomutase-like phosphatase (HAD superfamily)
VYNNCKPEFDKQLMLARLKKEGYLLGVGSNSIKESITSMITKAGIHQYFDHVVGNDEVERPKPDPQMYNRIVAMMGLQPSEVVIVEDSPHGIAAAKASGCNVCEVPGHYAVNYSKVKGFINELEVQRC